MDAHEQLVSKAEIAACVLGRGKEYKLIYVSEPEPIADAVVAAVQTGQMKFCGTLAVVNGKAAALPEPNLEAVLLCARAAIEFAEYVIDRRKNQSAERQQEPKGDSTSWLQKLFDLQDTRGGVN
jgi:hypothetical protein